MRTVVCLATGPSLTQADVDAVRGKATVIAVNDAHTLAPWADWLYSSDRYWWEFYLGVPSFQGQKAAIEHAKGRHSRNYPRWGIQVYRNTGESGLERKPDGLRTCGGNSGGAAVNLAAHLKPERIILLGYDMSYGAGQKLHFFGNHPRGLKNGHNFPTWRRLFAEMVQPMRELGIEVVNCSRVTALDCWPQMLLEQVL